MAEFLHPADLKGVPTRYTRCLLLLPWLLLLHSPFIAFLSLSLDGDGILVDQSVGIDRRSKVVGSQMDDSAIFAIARS